jgi:putative aldouronate transport system permease protein
VFLVAAGTSVSLFITAITAFAVSREQMKGAGALTLFFVVTMLIQGGIVPSYLVVRSLGLINSLWAMIFPVTVNTFFLIILKNFFANVPKSLEESAYMDGANELYIFFRIFVPLSVPAMVTIGLFYGVNYFNSFFLGILYLTDRRKWPLQLVLRDILIQSEMSDAGASGHYADRMSHGLKMATIIVAVVPIACIYPFLQKYFSKGVLIGAVKG